MPGIVYVLTNPAMPGFVKIGWTAAEEAATRIGQLYGTGVPFPFKLEFAAKVTDGREVEQALHTAFAPSRPNPRREFFNIEPEQAIVILKLLHTEDVTNELTQSPSGVVASEEVTQADVNAGTEYASRRPNLNFEEMGIPVGSVLNFRDDGVTVTVIGPKKIKYGEQELSLSAVTQALLGTTYAVAPQPYWTYQGKSLIEIYNETYS